jgi:hypothetical protein
MQHVYSIVTTGLCNLSIVKSEAKSHPQLSLQV